MKPELGSGFTSTSGGLAGQRRSARKADAAPLNRRLGGRRRKPNDEAAQMQSPEKPNRLTVKRAAKMLNVSPRSVYYIGWIRREAPDLIPDIQAGPLKVGQARRIVMDRYVRRYAPDMVAEIEAGREKLGPVHEAVKLAVANRPARRAQRAARRAGAERNVP